MSKWSLQKLENIADIKLSNVDKKTNEYERAVRLCNYTDVYKNAFINSDIAKDFMVASCNESEYEKFRLKKGQVAITKDSETRDDIGVPTYIAEDFEDVVLGYHLSLLTPIESKLHGRFLHYWLNSKQAKTYFENNAGGSGQRCTLTLDIIKSISINLPTLPLQKAIASILSDLDTKIEHNNKINTELEAMAKTLYDYWFVQFDFPNEKGKPYKSSGGKMVWNEELKREIPKDWEVKSLFEACSVRYGFPFSTNHFNEQGKGVPIIRIRDIIENSVNNFSTESGIDDKYLIQQGDLLIGMDGNFHLNYWSKKGCYLNQRVVMLKQILLNNIIVKHQVEPFIKLRERTVSRTTVGHLSDKDLKSIYILLPNISLLETVNKIFNTILNQIINNRNQNIELATLKDWLLPMLMNGQVTVGNMAHSKPIQPIVALNNMQLIPIITKRIKDKLGIGYGEVGIQKTVFNIFAVKGIDMNYKFINHNNGTYSSALKDDLKNNPYLAIDKTKKVFYVKEEKEAEINKLIGKEENKIFVDAVDSILEIYKNKIINKETYRIELLNTLMKLIADLQTIEFEKLYQGFIDWIIKNDHKHKTKAERFKRPTTQRMLEFIVKRKLHLNILKNE